MGDCRNRSRSLCYPGDRRICCCHVSRSLMTGPKSMYLCPSSFTAFPACPIVVCLDRGEHLTIRNSWKSLSSDEVTEFPLSPVSRGEISRLPRHSAENLYKDEEICNNITSSFIPSIFSSFIASIFNCHRTSPFRESILNHLQYATPHHYSRSYSIGFSN